MGSLTEESAAAVHGLLKSALLPQPAAGTFIPLVQMSAAATAGIGHKRPLSLTAAAMSSSSCSNSSETQYSASCINVDAHVVNVGAAAIEDDEIDHISEIALQWPPRSYFCSFCGREFCTAQALGGHMNVHRRQRALLKAATSLSPSPRVNPPLSEQPDFQYPNPNPNFNPNSTFNPNLYPNPNSYPNPRDNPNPTLSLGYCLIYPHYQLLNPLQNINNPSIPSTSLTLAPSCPFALDLLKEASTSITTTSDYKRPKLMSSKKLPIIDHHKQISPKDIHKATVNLELRL
ncbi:hypothetical protein L7F22_061236 [Adiantum nelumboides]|nr:hypothetical protein [Adiantum nelumboides]